MKRDLASAAAALLLLCAPARAQTPSDPPYATEGGNAGAPSVPLVYDTGCGCFRPIDAAHPLAVNASVSRPRSRRSNPPRRWA